MKRYPLTIIRTPASDISVFSRSASGVIVMRLPEGQYVANFTIVAKEEKEDELDSDVETEETVEATEVETPDQTEAPVAPIEE